MLDGLNHQQLIAFARPLVGDEAEDIVQAAYVKMLTTKSPHRGDAARQTWACKIVRHVALDYLRAQRRQVPTDPIEEDSPLEPAALARDPEAALDATRLVALLTIEERVIFETFTEPDRLVARRLKIGRTALRTARQALKEKLENLR